MVSDSLFDRPMDIDSVSKRNNGQEDGRYI